MNPKDHGSILKIAVLLIFCFI